MGTIFGKDKEDTSLRTKEYYLKSGSIHVSELGNLVMYLNTWEIISSHEDSTHVGRLFCDKNGINRDFNWCKIGDIRRSLNDDKYSDVEYDILGLRHNEFKK